MPGSFDPGDHVEQAVVLQEFVVHVQLHAADAFDGLRRHPDDGFVHHLLAVGLVELDGRRPGEEQAGVGEFSRLLEAGKDIPVLVGKPEFAAHHAARIFRLGQVGVDPLGVEVQRVHEIDRELAVHAGGVLPHGEIHAGAELAAVGPHFGFAAEGVDVDGKGLERDLVGAGPPEFLLEVFPGLVGTVAGIAAPLVFRGAQLPDDALEMRQVLPRQLQGGQGEQDKQEDSFHRHFISTNQKYNFFAS